MSKQSKHKNQNKKRARTVANSKAYSLKAELVEAKEPKNNKKAVLIIAAVLVVALAVAATVLLVKYFKGDFGQGTTEPVTIGETQQNEGEQYAYVEYDGSRIPVEFAEILQQAEIDSKAANKSQGTVLTIGKTEISKPEFRMYYHETVCAQYQKAADTELETGYNRSGIELNVDPAEQKHLQDSFSWEEHFINETVKTITWGESGFAMAMKDGFELDELMVAEVLEYCKAYKPDEKEMVSYFEGNFGKGATYSMYCAKYIRAYYAEAYKLHKAEELEGAVTDAELEKEYNDNRQDYLVMGCRVYPIEGKYENSEVNGISTEAEFLEFAEKNFATIYGEGHDVDGRTENRFVSYTTLNDVYAPEVAKWMFDPARKPGDIAVVETILYNYLCYVKTLPFDPFTADIYLCEMMYQNPSDQTVVDQNKKEAELAFEEWKKGEATLDSLKAKADEFGFVHDDYTAMANAALPSKMTYWIFDSAREEGDCDIFYTSEGAYIVYFKSHNKDDLEWKYHARSYLAATKFDNLYTEHTEKYFGNEKKDDKLIAKACDEAMPGCYAYSDRYRGSLGLTEKTTEKAK